MASVAPIPPSGGKRSRSEFEDGGAGTGTIKAEVHAADAEGFPIYLPVIEHS